MAVPMLAQFSRAPADLTLVEMTARGGDGTSVYRGSDPPLDAMGAVIDSADVVLGSQASPWMSFLPARTSSPSAIADFYLYVSKILLRVQCNF